MTLKYVFKADPHNVMLDMLGEVHKQFFYSHLILDSQKSFALSLLKHDKAERSKLVMVSSKLTSRSNRFAYGSTKMSSLISASVILGNFCLRYWTHILFCWGPKKQQRMVHQFWIL